MIGRHHLQKNVVEAMYHCNRCGKPTMHRVDGGKKGPCLDCMARRDSEHKAQEAVPVQTGLFA